MAKHKGTTRSNGAYNHLCKRYFENTRAKLKASSQEEHYRVLDSLYDPEVASTLKDRFAAGYETEPASFNMQCARYDYTLQKMKLREKGTLTYLPRMITSMADIMPRSEIPATFFHMNNLIINGGYDEQDQNHILTTAAAIWILDQLQMQDKLDTLYEILLSVEIPGSLFELPVFSHPTYPTELIEQTALLLIHRNDGLYEEGPIGTPLADEWTLTPVLQRPDATDKPLRSAFESLLALLDSEAVSSAAKRYEQKAWDFYRLVLIAEACCNNEKSKYAREIELIQKEIDALYANSQKAKVPPLNPLMVQPTEIPLFGNVQPPAFQQALTPLLQKKRKHQTVINHIDLTQSSLFTSLSLSNDREKYARFLQGIIPKDVEEQLVHFSVADPYETAFALLWLLDSGSLLPWAYYGSLSVAITAKDQLPFNARLCKHKFSPTAFALPSSSAYQHQYLYHQHPDMLDGDNEKVSREFGMNLSQVIYRCTNTLLPRLTSKVEEVQPDELLPLETDKEKMLMSALLNTLNARWLSPLGFGEYQLNSSTGDSDTSTSPVQEAATDTVSAEEYNRLKDELRKIKHNGYDVSLENRKLHQKIDSYETELNLLRTELHDLRTLVFQQQNSIEETQADAQIIFPQLVTKPVISFGGHVSWLNRIRTLLPNVRFISPDTQPNEDLLRNANEIWIQPNCLSHADFYKIINAVRSRHIPVRYFSYSSAEKCAEQLVISMESYH